jgi:hypothetical protein
VDICEKAIRADTHEIITMSMEEQSKALYDILLKIMEDRKKQVRTIESLMK